MAASRLTEMTVSDSKQPYQDVAEVDNASSINLAAKTSTPMDSRLMDRLGIRQTFVRKFQTATSTFFLITANGTWLFTLFAFTPALVTGGNPALVWSMIWNLFCYIPIQLSLAEMASMSPVAGAQYHWTSEFAPARFQKILSYYTGWYSTLSYQAGNVQGVLLSGTLVQNIIYLNNNDYAAPQWQGTLLTIAVTVVTLAANLLLTGQLHRLQYPMIITNFSCLIIMVVAVWVKAPHTSSHNVFFDWQNNAGWPSLSLAVLAGQVTGIYNGLGLDIVVHMSEETKDASRNIPIAMMSAFVISFSINIVTTITFAYGITDLKGALKDPTTYPALWVLQQTMSTPVLTAFLTVILVLLLCSNLDYLAAVSRDLFAFARDKGLPFSNHITHVRGRQVIPYNALLLSSYISIALSLIYIGSITAFYAMVSLFVVATLQCYMFSIASILWRRIYYPQTIPPSYWSLGKYGVLVNSLALVYMVYAFFWVFWPQYYPVEADTFNWASVMFVACFVIATGWYIFRARFVYKGPLEKVRGRALGKDDVEE